MADKEVAIRIIKRLKGKGFEALLAGGCVRDMLLGRAAKDYDVATNARPEQIMKLFNRTLKVGAQFGVVIVLINDEQVEVATFRAEKDYADGRHPSVVRFTSAAEDAGRRDFTINGMFYDPVEDKVVDYVGGRSDLADGIIRTIGRAEERFGEDYLRMLRAIRFCAQLGFRLERKTWLAVCGNAAGIRKISGERIAMELEGILTCPNRAEGARLLVESGLASQVFTDLDEQQTQLGVKVLSELPKKTGFAPALAGFFAGCSTGFALDKCSVLKLSRNQIKNVKFLLCGRGKLLNERMSLAELKMLLAGPYFEDLYELQKAIQKATVGGRKSIAALISLKQRIRDMGDIELQPKPLLDGHGLMRLGAAPGPLLGHLSRQMYVAQLEGQIETVPQARIWVRRWLKKHTQPDS